MKGLAITAVLTDEPDVLAYVDTSSIEEEELPVFIAGNLSTISDKFEGYKWNHFYF